MERDTHIVTAVEVALGLPWRGRERARVDAKGRRLRCRALTRTNAAGDFPTRVPLVLLLPAAGVRQGLPAPLHLRRNFN